MSLNILLTNLTISEFPFINEFANFETSLIPPWEGGEVTHVEHPDIYI
jgi:hypothetical protein